MSHSMRNKSSVPYGSGHNPSDVGDGSELKPLALLLNKPTITRGRTGYKYSNKGPNGESMRSLATTANTLKRKGSQGCRKQSRRERWGFTCYHWEPG